DKGLEERSKRYKKELDPRRYEELSTEDKQLHRTPQTITLKTHQVNPIHLPIMHYSTLLSIVVTTFTLTPSIISHAIPKPVALAPGAISDLAARAPPEGSDPTPFPFDEADTGYLEDVFNTIESIPDSTLDAGPEAVKEWVDAHQAAAHQRRSTALVERQDWLQIGKCALAIGKAIAENALPISKIRRIRELIKVLGGAKEVAKMLLKAKSIKQLIIIGGPELQEIAEILLGITDVVNECFSF
ncbi:MAG: hypothetical protein Q9193_005725, partial [Seirophora villosa]